jgi:hypothetical protein
MQQTVMHPLQEPAFYKKSYHFWNVCKQKTWKSSCPKYTLEQGPNSLAKIWIAEQVIKSTQTLNPLLFLLPLAFSNFLPFDRT